VVEQRRAARHRLIKSAQMIFPAEGMISDCVVFDLSDEGALVELKNIALVPPEVVLCLSTEDIFLAQRIWQMGKKLGLQFVKRESAEHDTVKSLRLIESILDKYGPLITAKTLRAARHYSDEDFRRAIEEAEDAEAKLTSILSAIKTIALLTPKQMSRGASKMTPKPPLH
jgi:hypothetical protein